ncbi:hypothetical protein LXL04_039149 [Taraxacum kok-saghyz]
MENVAKQWIVSYQELQLHHHFDPPHQLPLHLSSRKNERRFRGEKERTNVGISCGFLELRSGEKEINNEREASNKRGEELPEIRWSCRCRWSDRESTNDRRSNCEGGGGAVAVAGEGAVAGGCSTGVGNLESIMQEAEGSVGFDELV